MLRYRSNLVGPLARQRKRVPNVQVGKSAPEQQEVVVIFVILPEYPVIAKLVTAVLQDELLQIEACALSVWSSVSTSSAVCPAPGNDASGSHRAQPLLPAHLDMTAQRRYLEHVHLLMSTPEADRNLSTAVQIFAQFRILDVAEAQTTIDIRKTRANLMLGNHALWTWLDCWIPQQCHRMNASSLQLDRGSERPKGQSWLSSLFYDACQMVFTRDTAGPRSFVSTEYAVDSLPAVCQIAPRAVPFRPSLEQSEELAVRITQDVVSGWLGMTDSTRRWSGWFVGALLETFDPHVLYLDYIWKAYETMKRGSLLKQHSRSLDYTKMEPFKAALRTHPLHDTSSPESSLVHRIGQLVEVDSMSNAQNLLAHAPPLNYSTPLPRPIFEIKEHRLRAFADFITQSLQVFYHEVEMPAFSYDQQAMDYRINDLQTTKLQQAMLEDPDFLLPFREHTPWRLRQKGKEGPFDAVVLTKPAALFSAVVGRVITFRTEFGRREPMFFDGLVGWRDTIKGINDESYMCNPQAYGRFNPRRNTALAAQLWKGAEECGWPLFATQDHNFWEVYDFLRTPGISPPRFPQLGDLTAYLLAADYAYTSVAQKPSLHTIAKCIASINRGAAAGLELLGHIPERTRSPSGAPKKPPVDQCRAGVELLHDFLGKFLTPQQQVDVTFDFIMDKNALCKFSHTVHLKLISL